MFPSPPSSTTQELLLNIYNRRLLLHPPLYYHPPPPSASPTTTQTDTYTTVSGFDANVIMVLSVLLCALFCSLGLNSIIRCTIRCSTFINRNHSNHDGIESRRISSATLVNIGGVTKKALKTFPTVSYSAEQKPPGLDSGCVICLSEFVTGEKVRLLPKCNHGFHVRCIDKWLDSHSSCPTCRSCLLDTCHKIVGGCNQASSSEPPPGFGVNVAPLAREDMVHRSSDTS